MSKRSAVHHVINTARKQLNMSERDLWVAYRGSGGLMSEQAISAFLRGTTVLGEPDINDLAVALNDRFTGKSLESSTTRAHVPYQD